VANSHRFSKILSVAAALTFGAGLLTGCGPEGLNCSSDACTVTINRGPNAQATLVDVVVKLVKVTDKNVTLKIDDETFQVPIGGESKGIKVREVTDDKVVVEVPNGMIS
jgi:hypothetical protein